MSGLKTKAAVTFVLLASFIWGLKKNDLGSLYSFSDNAPPSSTLPADSQSPAAGADGKTQQTKPPADTSTKASVAQNSPTRLGTQTPTAPATPAPATGTTANFTPPRNPYAGLSEQLKAQAPNDSFKEAFGSINRESLSQEELIKRNSYFRQLSQDLNRLQGEQPPSTDGDTTSKSEPAEQGSEVVSDGAIEATQDDRDTDISQLDQQTGSPADLIEPELDVVDEEEIDQLLIDEELIGAN